MPGFALGRDLPVGDVQRGKSVVALVAEEVAHLRRIRAHRQQRLSALEGLHLALSNRAQNQGIFRWLEVKPDHVAHLLR